MSATHRIQAMFGAAGRICRQWCAITAILAFASGGIQAESTETPNSRRDIVPADDVLREIEIASQLPGGASLQDVEKSPLRIWVKQVHLWQDNAYTPNSTKYLAVSVTLINTGLDDIEVSSGKILLRGWNSVFPVGAQSKESLLMPIMTERDSQPLHELATPENLKVPAGKAAKFWAVFLNLRQVNNLSELSIELPLASGGLLSHDLRSEQRARLGLTVETLGPKQALALLEIHGALNSINAHDLAVEIRKQVESGSNRIVINWSDGAPPVNVNVIDWLLARGMGDVQNPLYLMFPHFSETTFLGLSNLPKENADVLSSSDQSEFVFEEPQDAVLKGLVEVLSVVDPAYVVQEIRSGHPYSRRAALASLADRQDRANLDNLFPLLSQLYDSSDDRTRQYDLLAIGQQSHPEAIQMLSNVVTQVPSDAEAGFVALLKSPRGDAVITLQELVRRRSARLPLARQVELLAENYRREWDPFLIDALEDSAPDVRAAAVNGFVTVGHPELTGLLASALQDESEKVRNSAFKALVARQDGESEQLAINYALELLKLGDANDTVLEIVKRTRNVQAAPLLVEMIKRDGNGRARLLPILEEVGNEASVRELLAVCDKFAAPDRIQVYQLAVAFDLPELIQLARRALAAEDAQVRQMGIEMLAQQVSDEAANAIYGLLSNATEAEHTTICYALGRIGTEESERLLRKIRQQAFEEKNESLLALAKDGLRLWLGHSPGSNAIETAYYHSRVENYENALTYFKLAADIDPDLGVAYSGMGNTYLKLMKYEEARNAFAKAYELDDFDGQAITGLGIVEAMQGNVEQAVERAVTSAEKFPKDDIFAYNTACVYGRGIEFILREGTDDQKKLIPQYEAAAIQALKDSIEYGFTEWSLMKTDPDIHALRELPEFKDLLEE